ncbi:MAG: hypothetical protein KAH11_08355 [Rhodospirillales bacterium]|nr:hypothetical protein [Rhodospirillales bacterium]
MLLAVGTSISAAAQTVSDAGNGQSAPGAVDCTDVSVNYQEDPNLTKAEQIALMDAALMSSLSKFDVCQSENGESQGQGSAGGGGGSSGSASGGGASVASSDMSGADSTPSDQQPGQSSSSWEPVASTDNGSPQEEGSGQGADVQSASVSNGKVPDDIPPGDNDSILEAQIRQAAMNEKDPAVAEKLWDEYRKYKGLPKKN